jgi:hypothetical protein
MKIILSALIVFLSLIMSTQVLRGESSEHVPESVLIAWKAEDTALDASGIEDPKIAEALQKAFDEYVSLVVQNMDAQLVQLGINSYTYFHRDAAKSIRQSIFHMMNKVRFNGIIQLKLDVVKTIEEHSIYLFLEYIKVDYTPAAEGTHAKFMMGHEEKYRIWSSALKGGASASRIAAEFVEELRMNAFGN